MVSIIHRFSPGALICSVHVNGHGAPVNSVWFFRSEWLYVDQNSLGLV